MGTRAGIDYGELDLKSFVRFLIDTGRASLEVKTNLPQREALQHAIKGIWRLGHAIGEAKLSSSELLMVLAYTFEIGTCTLSDSSKVVAKYLQAKVASAAPGKPGEKRATSAEINRIIDGIIDGCRSGAAQNVIVREAYTELTRRGHTPTDASVRRRVQRRLKARSLREGKKVRRAL